VPGEEFYGEGYDDSDRASDIAKARRLLAGNGLELSATPSKPPCATTSPSTLERLAAGAGS